MKSIKGDVSMKKIIKKIDENSELIEYSQTLVAIKQRIHESQIKAMLSVNTELLKLYWDIGRIISERVKTYGWGSSVVEKLSEDIQKAFPGLAGFSRRNVFRMQAFFVAYQLVPQPVALIEDFPIFMIPWGHNAVLLQKIKSNEERFWYAEKTIENGWSRTILEMQIESDLYHRLGKAITNFKDRLPLPDSDLAQQSFKDPYIWDFLTLHEKYMERDLEQGLIDNVQKLLLEMGKGFALVGRQYHIVVGPKDYYIDLLFYHIELRCYVVVELKAREFAHTDAGQIGFYLAAIDNNLKSAHDNPTIGLILCKDKDHYTAEYALQNINAPVGIASYQIEIMNKLPKELKSKLPTIAELEHELEKQDIMTKLTNKK